MHQMQFWENGISEVQTIQCSIIHQLEDSDEVLDLPEHLPSSGRKSNGPGFKTIGRELKVLEGKENQHKKSAQNGKKALAPYVPQIAVNYSMMKVSRSIETLYQNEVNRAVPDSKVRTGLLTVPSPRRQWVDLSLRKLINQSGQKNRKYMA
ncbi:hypothetical protein K438DRAFT_1747601 [Mycena galopus ATCC 62051]|nr:hypothetical protein K438DRAFT_1747601 [Mycena galopus ATCC 62051]